MKILFHGDSWTYGDELARPTESRFSKLICDHYQAEETNLSACGNSNHRIYRELLDIDITQYDLAFIQMSIPFRKEYYCQEKGWVSITPTHKKYENFKSVRLKKGFKEANILDHSDFFLYYYMNIYHSTYGKTEERMFFKSIQNYFKVNHVPFVLSTILTKTKTELPYDILLCQPHYSRSDKGHPNELGHQQIAHDLIEINKKKNNVQD